MSKKRQLPGRGDAVDVVMVAPSSLYRAKEADPDAVVSPTPSPPSGSICTDFHVRFPPPRSSTASSLSLSSCWCCEDPSPGTPAPIPSDPDAPSSEDTWPSSTATGLLPPSPTVSVLLNDVPAPSLSMLLDDAGAACFADGLARRPSPAILLSLLASGPLRPGRNDLRFSTGKDSDLRVARASLWVWDAKDAVAVSDIDGTVTVSDIRGLVTSCAVRRDGEAWPEPVAGSRDAPANAVGHVHGGICALYAALAGRPREGEGGRVRFLYLTSRPLAMMSYTRAFLARVAQYGVSLPPGPVFCHPGSVGEVLLMETWHKNPDLFKGRLLKHEVLRAFHGAGRQKNERVFVAGFGNKATDARAYRTAGMRPSDIYIIDPWSKIVCPNPDSFEHSDPKKNYDRASPQRKKHILIEMNSFKKNAAVAHDNLALPSPGPFCSYSDALLLDSILARMGKPHEINTNV